MKMLIAAMALAVAMPVHAQAAPVRFEVSATDLDLNTKAGVERLTSRLYGRIRAHCGRLIDYALGAPHPSERFAECVGQFVVESNHPAAQVALDAAIKRVRG